MKMHHLTVLYDARCPLCSWGSRWLSRQRQLVPLRFVPAGSPMAQQLFPGLDHARTLNDITVVSDRGDVYQNDKAWIICLWSLKRYRKVSSRLASPALAPGVKRFVATVSKYRPVNAEAGAGCTDGQCR